MRGIRCAVVALLAAGIVAVVGAQPPRPGGGGGGGADTYTLVLTNAALQEEVKITAEQKEKFKPVADKQAELAKKNRDAFSGGKFDKEKFAEIREEGKKVAEEAKKVLDDTLTAAQKKRLKQIGVQALGVNAFAEIREEEKGKGGFGQSEATKAVLKEVGDALKLSDSQKTKVKEILAEHGKDRAAIQKDVFGETKGKGGKGAAPDPEKTKDFAAKSTKLSAETMSKIADVLDETQKKAWKELTGDAFDTSKLITPRTAPKKD